MTDPLLVPLQMGKAFFPICFKRLPNKSEFIKTTPTLIGKLVLVNALGNYPAAEIVAVYFVFWRNTTITDPLLVTFQATKPFLPTSLNRVPYS
jgi:hypothetical protein